MTSDVPFEGLAVGDLFHLPEEIQAYLSGQSTWQAVQYRKIGDQHADPVTTSGRRIQVYPDDLVRPSVTPKRNRVRGFSTLSTI